MLTVLLAVTVALGGASALGLGVRAFFGARLPHPRRRVRRRLAVAAATLGGLLLLLPDVVAGALTGAGHPEVVTTLVLVLYRLGVLGLLGAVTLALVAGSDPVTSRFCRLLGTARTLSARVPGAADGSTRALRRSLPGFPTQWDAVVEHDRALAAYFLRHQREVDPAAPALSDLAEPLTREVAEAMFRCDRLRPEQTPFGHRDPLASDYGRAVAAFDAALRAADEHARTLATTAVEPHPAATLALPAPTPR